MIKTTRSIKSAANFEKTKGEASSNIMVDDSIVGSGEDTNQTNSAKGKNQAKTTKSKILVKSKNHDFPPNFRNKKVKTGFLTPKARLVFT